MSNLQYRPEIDGLRAIAVAVVVLYHAGFKFFGGGLVGVDIFFVISGYLITGILMKDFRAEGLSLAKFHERRCRRIHVHVSNRPGNGRQNVDVRSGPLR